MILSSVPFVNRLLHSSAVIAPWLRLDTCPMASALQEFDSTYAKKVAFSSLLDY